MLDATGRVGGGVLGGDRGGDRGDGRAAPAGEIGYAAPGWALACRAPALEIVA
jgi:hypothetical protein